MHTRTLMALVVLRLFEFPVTDGAFPQDHGDFPACIERQVYVFNKSHNASGSEEGCIRIKDIYS